MRYRAAMTHRHAPLVILAVCVRCDTVDISGEPVDSMAERCIEDLGLFAYQGTAAEQVVPPACVMTGACEGDAAWMITRPNCYGSYLSYYDASGTLIAAIEWVDYVGICEEEDRSYRLFGRELDVTCDGVKSAACVVPPQATSDMIGAPLRYTSWAEISEGMAQDCLGVAVCSVGGEEVTFIAEDDLPCEVSFRVSAWAAGEQVQLASEHLEACWPPAFQPTAACGVVAPPG